MLSWKVGAVTVSAVVESLRIVPDAVQPVFIPAATPDALRRIAWLAPHFIDADGRLRIAIQALLVEAPGLRLIVDTCIGEDGTAPETAPFLAALAEAGWPRDSVTHVLCTHLHFDHVGWNTCLEDGRWVPTFPRARYLFARIEHEHWSGRDDHDAPAILARSVQPVLDAGLADLVETDHRLSAEVRLVPTHGHTPGHVSVRIESEGHSAMITGDMTHHPCQMARPDWATGFDSDCAQGVRTREAVFAGLAGSPTLLIGTHFAAPTAGLVVRDGEGFRLVTG
ncbi:MBL fold metallo-hydrolase [Novosphingobium bradum]|uniref:MBL fold metallo-hydrolase n=1 Tax=Novosphingobium bradum TaxID=1737444 RepID=A0ABV7IKF1_9SPHN